jgi:membrane protease YdiL (CAAX protease family)
MTDQVREGWWARLGNRPAAPPWSSGEALLAVAALLISMIVIASAITITLTAPASTPETGTFISGWAVGLLLSAAFVLIRWRRSAQKFAGLAYAAPHYPLFLALLLGVAAGLTADLLAAWGSGGFFPSAALIGVDGGDVAGLLLAVIFTVILQPAVEGLIFFGVVLPRLRASLGGYAGMFAAALLFGGYYALVFGARLTDSSVLWYGFIAPLLVGVMAAVMRAHTGSTRAATITLMGAGMTAVAVLLTIA